MRIEAPPLVKLQRLFLGGLVLLILMSIGCARQRRAVFAAPAVLRIEHPESLSDTQLEEIAKCEYWGVCIFQQYEEVEAFGPNFLFDGRLKYVPKKRCRFKECERLEAFYVVPRD